ncbi:hypothetical protein UlMin_019635 [Ulmus minor]
MDQTHQNKEPQVSFAISFLSRKNPRNPHYNLPLLVLNYFFLFVGSLSSCLLSKYYFIHKGSSIWVSTWVQCAGFPFLFLPIFLPYLLKCSTRKPFSHFTLKIFTLSILIGFLLGLNNFLFSWGNYYLPVSTSSLLLSSQLAFNLILSVLLVKQRITFNNLNCVILIVISSVLLALESSHDKPEDISKTKYLLGFFCSIGAGLLFALYLPLMEIIYKKVYCYAMVMEMQMVMEFGATLLATIGMVRESLVFDKGPRDYYTTVCFNVVTWQLCFIGTAGMVFLTSSLTGGICMTALMAMNVVGGVFVYGDAFGGVKIVSTLLSSWGFASYVFGLYIKMKLERKEEDKRNNNINTNENNNSRNNDVEMVIIDNDRV